MDAVVTPSEMRHIDATAAVNTGTLIERAGWAVARSARDLMGGTYGRRVTVVAGPGNNGADGVIAARVLRQWGVRTRVVSIERNSPPPAMISNCDLVIDAAFGTGFRGDFVAPAVGSIPVLAVDIPSGVDGLTGEVPPNSRPFVCVHTCTFAAWKPGLLFGDGPNFSGSVEVVDIGLPTPSAAHLLDAPTAAARLPLRDRSAHKWHAAVFVVGGSAGMAGAPSLAARAAMRAGAGMVRLGIPGDPHPGAGPLGAEVVGIPLPAHGWHGQVLDGLERCRALVVGPGLGRDRDTLAGVGALLESTLSIPVVVDADGLAALSGWHAHGRSAGAGVVVTPHDGEFGLMTGNAVGADRIGAVRELSAAMNAVVLLKGPTTVVADPTGRVELVANGDSRLATAGSGDVLSGIIGALLAQGVPAFEAAATGAFVHGGAASLGPQRGMVAGDIIDRLPAWFEASGQSTIGSPARSGMGSPVGSPKRKPVPR